MVFYQVLYTVNPKIANKNLQQRTLQGFITISLYYNCNYVDIKASSILFFFEQTPKFNLVFCYYKSDSVSYSQRIVFVQLAIK